MSKNKLEEIDVQCRISGRKMRDDSASSMASRPDPSATLLLEGKYKEEVAPEPPVLHLDVGI